MNRLLQFFTYGHLPAWLHSVSAPCKTLAEQMERELMESPEKTAGLRKLLEAKDCFVRAKIEQQTAQNPPL